ncbi:MAG: hypothetical protein FJX44_11045 [Alphaproteobacteria bacterium]|nr:hypothetical protein [Alphaproteobacteria bacterium]
MAKHEKRTRPDGDQGHSVLDGPEYIEGVPGQKRTKQASRKRDDCDSVLDAPECIDGVDKDARESRHQ